MTSGFLESPFHFSDTLQPVMLRAIINQCSADTAGKNVGVWIAGGTELKIARKDTQEELLTSWTAVKI